MPNPSILEGAVRTTQSQPAVIEHSSEPQVRLYTVKHLYHYNLLKADKPVSDGTIVHNGTLKAMIRSGATLTNDIVIAALKIIEELKQEKVRNKESNPVLREELRR